MSQESKRCDCCNGTGVVIVDSAPSCSGKCGKITDIQRHVASSYLEREARFLRRNYDQMIKQPASYEPRNAALSLEIAEALEASVWVLNKEDAP